METYVNSKTEQLEELLPAHWLDSQRLMVGLTLALVQDAGSATSLALMDEALGYLRPPAGVPDPSVETAYLTRLETIHPATLKRLTDLTPALLPAKWASHISYWEKAHFRQHDDGERFPLVGARLVADRILNSHLTPAQIQQLGAAELSPDWQNSFPSQRLAPILSAAQSSKRGDPHDVLKALAQFRENSLPTRWEIVENALFQQLFIWPLLILETEQTSLEFSLPALLRVATTKVPLPAVVNAGPLNAAQWEVSIGDASNAAKGLWHNKHKSSPPWLKEALEHLSASVDLGFAARIVAPYDVGLRLTGDSAEAYFALAILGAFIDPSAIENVCATGSLGDEKPDREGGGDRKLHEPGYVNAKFRYARDSYFFDTFLSPKPSIGVASQRHIHVPREVKINFYDPNHTYFSHFCDHVFGQKWRKHQYVRAPDLAEAFKPSDREERKKRQPQEDSQVIRVLKGLRENSKPALHIDDIPPEKVAAALGVVNGAVHWTRLGSYAFLRAVPDAINDRMWWPIWELISGLPDDFRQFRFAASSHLAAEALAREMNKIHPNKSDPRRAPDVLVVAYTSVDLHYASDSAIPGSPFERLRIKPMIEAINSLSKGGILRSSVPGLHEHIGQTRLIFVRDTISANGLIGGEFSGSSLDEEARDALNRLSVFRYGFKREHARHVLNVSEDNCDRILAKLRIPVPDNGGPLVYTEGGGEYYLTRLGSEGITGPELAKLHFGAANAITGLLSPRDGAFRTNLRDALSPRWVQEAQWHLQEAHRHTGRQDTNRLRELRGAQQRVSRLAEPFGWTNVRWLIRAMRGVRVNNLKPIPEADFLLDAIQVHFKNRRPGVPKFLSETHPTEHVLAARYCNELAVQNNISLQQKKYFAELRNGYIEIGWKRIHEDEDFGDYEYRTCIFLQFASEYCMMMAESHKFASTPRANYLENRIDYFLGHQNFIDHYDLELFEYLGDRSDDPHQAMRWYRMGICNPRVRSMSPWPSLAFKYVGAAKVAGVSPPDQVKSALDRLWLTSDPKKMSPVGGLWTLPGVKQRWEMGRNAILKDEHEFETYGTEASS